MAIGFTNSIVTADGRLLPFHRYEPGDEAFRSERLEAFEIETNCLNSRLIFDEMVAVEGRLDGEGVLICFNGSRAIEFQRGLGQCFLDSRPMGEGLAPSASDQRAGLRLTVFGILRPEGPEGYGVQAIHAAAWSYESKPGGLVTRRILEGHLPAFPV